MDVIVVDIPTFCNAGQTWCYPKNENIAVEVLLLSLSLIVFYFKVVRWYPRQTETSPNQHGFLHCFDFVYSFTTKQMCLHVCMYMHVCLYAHVCLSVYPDSCKTSTGARLDPAVRPPLSQPIMITLSLLLAPCFISTHAGEIRPF